MGWTKEAITDGELDALARAARAACNQDTRYPLWRGSSRHGQGECHNIARWLVSRLGGKVGAAKGHYVWLSPDESYYIDLTGSHAGDWIYTRNSGTYHAVPGIGNGRSLRFAKRADRIFDSLDKIIRLGLDYAGDAYPAQEPQAADDSERFNDSWQDPEQYWHDEPDPTTPEGVYQFVYANGQLEVSPNHGHDELAQHAGINPAEHTGPFAAGHVVVTNGQATWEVQANVNLHAFFKILKDAAKQYGWKWGGMTDAQGQPILEHEFGPKKSATIFNYVLLDDHLLLGRTSSADLAASSDRSGSDRHVLHGTVRILGGQAWVHPVHIDAIPHLFEWATDRGLTLYGGNDNVIKTIPDLQQEDVYNPQTPESPNPMEPPPRLDTGLYRCPGCQQLFPNWHEYSRHRPECAEWASEDPEANGDNDQLPSPDHNDTFGDGAHYTEMRQEPGITTGKVVILPARTWKEAARVDGFERYAGVIGKEDGTFYVAYRNGDPLGYACVGDDGALRMVYAAVENQGIGTALYRHVMRHHASLYSNSMHDKSTHMLQKMGWLNVKGHRWKWAAGQDPKDMLEAPMPFIYDVNKDKIYTGHPGSRTSDIPGKFTPGGIVEGQYEPGGKVIIRSMTSVPYTVRHLIELWYYTQPYMEVKSVHLQDDAGKDTRLAATGDQKLDELLEEYRQQFWGGAQSGEIAPEEVEGMCTAYAHELAKFLNDNGVQAEVRYLNHPSEIGYTDRTRVPDPDEGHAVVVAGHHTIDFAAAQYGYSEFPMILVDGKRISKLAAVDPGTFVKTMALADPAVDLVFRTLRAAGGEVYVVGGAVRDAILDKTPHDFDLMVTGLPEPKVAELLNSLPGNVAHEGQDFKTFHYTYKGNKIEVSLPRRERSTGAGHQDFDVQSDHTMTPEEDFYRRDFTVNAMGVNLDDGRLVDPFGGKGDCKSRTLRTLNDRSLAEDPLRVLRGVVAAGKHGLQPDEATRNQMTDNAQGLTNLPPERILYELDKLMTADNPAQAIRLAHETGVLKYVLPEVEDAFGFNQNNPHHELELGDHLLSVLDRISQKTKDPDLRLAALLHDIGKPGSAWKDPETGSNHYYEHHMDDGTVLGADHEKLGATLARERMEALRYPKERTRRVSELVKHHMWPGFTTDRGARRYLHRVGDHADDLLTLRWADQGGKSAYPTSDVLNLDTQRRLVDRVRNEGEATSQAQLAINGNDLIQAGITPGPIMGQILNYLTERVVDDPTVNTPEQLLTLAQDYAKLQEQ